MKNSLISAFGISGSTVLLAAAAITTLSIATSFATAAEATVAVPTTADKAATKTAPVDGKLGFVVTYFYYAMAQGDGTCPKGMWPIKSSKEFLATKSPEERERLLQPGNKRELYQKMVERGPNGENVCQNPHASPDPQMYTLVGNLNDGLDLDGKKDDKATTDYTCAHKQYKDAQGSTGIDNQLGRVLACINGLREKGTLVPYFTQAMRNGMWSMLIDVSGVDDVRNDADVRVDIYAGNENMAKSPNGDVLAGASLSPKTDPKLHRQFKGRIVNGVLETEAIADMFIPDIMATNRRPAMAIERPRLRLELLANGNAKGFLGGYISKSQYDAKNGDGEGEQYTGMDCHAIHYAVAKNADGGRDPATGECSTLSTAFRIEAVPAFIVRPDQQEIPAFSQREQSQRDKSPATASAQ